MASMLDDLSLLTNLHRQVIVDLPAQRPGISTVSIPAASVVERMGIHRAPAPLFAPQSPISRAHEQLWKQVNAYVDSAVPHARPGPGRRSRPRCMAGVAHRAAAGLVGNGRACRRRGRTRRPAAAGFRR